MSWLIRLGYLLIVAGVLTPISGNMLDHDLHRQTHFYYSSLAAVLFLLGLLAVSIGRRDRDRHSRGDSTHGAR